MKMKKIGRWTLRIGLGLVVLYCIAWVGGRYWLGHHYNQALETAKQKGVSIQAQKVAWGGFPCGYSLTWTQPVIELQRGNEHIKASSADLTAEWVPWRGFYFTWQSKSPTQVELTVTENALHSPPLVLTTQKWQGNASFNEPHPSFEVGFDHLNVQTIKTGSTVIPELHFDQLALSWLLERPYLDVNPSYFIYKAKLDVNGWQIPEAYQHINPIFDQLVAALGARLNQLNVHLTFPASWATGNQNFIKAWQEDKSPLTIDKLAVNWGDFKGHAEGVVFLDEKGQIMPDVAIKTENSGKILKVIAAQPGIDKSLASILLLAGPALLSDVRLMSEGNDLYVGPVKVGPLPRLQIQ